MATKATTTATPTTTPDEVATPTTPTTPGKRNALPATHVTPVGLTKLINDRKLYNGGNGLLTSQAMYSYIKNAPADHPFPLVTINGRDCVEIGAGVEWWVEKDARVAKRAELAAIKRAMVPSTEARDAKANLRRAIANSAKANDAFDKVSAKLAELEARVNALRAEATNAAAMEYHAENALATIAKEGNA